MTIFSEFMRIRCVSCANHNDFISACDHKKRRDGDTPANSPPPSVLHVLLAKAQVMSLVNIAGQPTGLSKNGAVITAAAKDSKQSQNHAHLWTVGSRGCWRLVHGHRQNARTCLSTSMLSDQARFYGNRSSCPWIFRVPQKFRYSFTGVSCVN